MMKQVQISRIALTSLVGIALCGCQTVKMPKIDIMKSPEFSEEAANIATDYPRVRDAPLKPEDIRSDRQWDKDARALQRLRSASREYDTEIGLSEAESKAKFDKLKAKVDAYKQDDPVGGPQTGDFDYQPRR